MEESIIKSDSHIEGISKDNLTYDIWKSLGLKEVSPRQLSPLVLAYIGDSIFDLVVKTMIVTKGNTQVNKMNRMASSIVKAESQSKMIGYIEDKLSEEEEGVYKRGRNAKSVSPAKNQAITDYRRATGFEALLGYLYLKKEWKRMLELVKIGLDSIKEQ